YAQTLLRRGDGAEAELWLRKLEKLPEAKGSYAVVVLNARLLAEQERGPDAVATLQKFLDQEQAVPAQQPGRLILVPTLLEQLHQQHGKSRHRNVYAETAEKLYRQLTELDRGRVLDLIAFLGRHGRAAEALQLCEGAWEHCPAEAVAGACVAVLRSG